MRCFALCFVFLAGCQCFVPVDEFPNDASIRDGGIRDSGSNTASDAGVACRAAADCVNPPIDLSACQSKPLVGSCLNQRCVYECSGAPFNSPRTCVSEQEPCFQCATGRVCADCAMSQNFTWTLGTPTGNCPSFMTAGAVWKLVPFSGRCGSAIVVDGGVVGTWLFLNGATSVLSFESAGVSCLASDSFTNLPRMVVSCPGCFVGITGQN
jgi:hypothetical protein